MDFYKRALELKDEIVSHRRYFHQNAEIGLDMPKAHEYVSAKLREYGIEPHSCGYGITAELGQGSPVLLLRADMDALPMVEMSGEDFACTDEKDHACGHDLHAAMLLVGAKMLKESENELMGTVRLMFQTAEETLEGCRNMIENGILDAPHVDAALAFHVGAGKIPPGTVMYNSSGVMMSSADFFRIDIKGKGGHGAYQHMTVDPLRIAVHIYSALESLAPRETSPEKSCVVSVGKINGGSAANIIPDSAVIEGAVRTDDNESRQLLLRRIGEISESTAQLFGGMADVIFTSQNPPLICDNALTEKMVRYLRELSAPLRFIPDTKASASDDFALIAEAVPSVYMYLSAGFEDENGDYAAHNPKVRFNEDALVIGAAAFAHCAMRFLSESNG